MSGDAVAFALVDKRGALDASTPLLVAADGDFERWGDEWRLASDARYPSDAPHCWRALVFGQESA